MSYSGNEIAIIGIDIKVPGGDNLEEFWEMLLSGKEGIKDIEIEPYNLEKIKEKYPNYVNKSSNCDNYDMFDADFFGYSTHEARIMDPQQRLFLQSCWKAIEDSGYDPYELVKRVGVIGSVGYNTYLINALKNSINYIDEKGYYDVLLGNDKDYLSTRVSYKLGLSGPSMTVQSACSSSLLAVHLACQNLLLGECDICLAGGSNVRVTEEKGYYYQPGFILSKDGHCRSFDNEGNGTVFGSGIGVVVLKRLEDAIIDKDHIYAVIKASLVNNDGNAKIGFTAPSQEGQEDIINRTLKLEDIEPESIRFYEAHGTGTNLGDPIELKAIINSLKPDACDYPCAIGSIKSNIGHMDVAAGIVGLIKAALCLSNKTIVPNVNFEKLNNNVSFDNTRFYIPKSCEMIENNSNFHNRAVVSSLGVGGTNVCLVLENSPDLKLDKDDRLLHEYYIIKFSAKSKESLKKMMENIKKSSYDEELSHISYTMNTGRTDFRYRGYFIYSSINSKSTIVYQSNIYDSEQNISQIYKNFSLPNDVLKCQCLYEELPLFKESVESWIKFLYNKDQIDFYNIEARFKNIIIKASLYELLYHVVLDYSFLPEKYYEYIKNNDKIHLFDLLKGEITENNYFKPYDLYKIIAEIWLGGKKIEWSILYKENEKRHVSAPTYIFDEKRFWYDDKQIINIWEERKCILENEEKAYNGMYLILINNIDNLNRIVDYFKVKGISNYFIDDNYLGKQKNNLSHHLDILFEKLDLSMKADLRIVSLLDSEKGIDCKDIFYRLIYLMRNFVQKNNSIKYSLIMRVNYDSNDLLSTSNMLLSGIATTLSREYPNIEVKMIECDDKVSLERILMEATYKINNKIVYLNNEKRYKYTYSRVFDKNEESILNSGSIYVITGGTGNAGLLIAKEIVKRVKATIILISKSYTEEALRASNSEKEKKIYSTILSLRKKGCLIVVLKTNIADYDEVNTMKEYICSNFGEINGIIHAAGKVGKAQNYIQDLSYENIKYFSDAKVLGAFNLIKAFKSKKLDFMILISSTVSILGGIGDSIYSGCNSVLNKIANITYHDLNIISVAFDYMPRIIKDKDVDDRKKEFKGLLINQISQEQMSYAFDKIFAANKKQFIVISNDDFEARYTDFDKYSYQKTDSNLVDKNASYNELIIKVKSLWDKVLEENCSINTNFFDSGGDSFGAIKLTALLTESFGIEFTTKYIYEYTTITLMAENIFNRISSESSKVSSNSTDTNKKQSVSIIGLAGIFPGANNIYELWDNLLNKKVSISHFSKDEYENLLNAKEDRNLNRYVGARGIIDDVDKFDYQFFGISKYEADLIDPQQRKFLEVTWQALENAGIINLLEKYKIAVFASQGISSYLINVLIPNKKIMNDYNNIAIINNSPDSLATRVSYALDLKGISKTIQTFCSSSLVSIQEAMLNIENGNCDIAIVGGVNIVIPQITGYIYNERSIYSKNGMISPFDESADGTVFSNGVGVVILASKSIVDDEKLSSYAEIIGVSVNNDGSQKASFLSPSVKGQADCIADVYRQSKIDVEKVAYVETHGTGTKVGDPIEIYALEKAFNKFTNKNNFCAIGSIKGNIGHLDRAAGIASIIKACLIAENKCIPPIANYNTLNKQIDFEKSPFYINKKIKKIPINDSIYVGVSALGVGGTNAHIMLEGKPKNGTSNNQSDIYIIPFSAKSQESLRQMISVMYAYLLQNKGINMKELAYTLQFTRRHFSVRYSVPIKSIEELIIHMKNYTEHNTEKINTIILYVPQSELVFKKIVEKIRKKINLPLHNETNPIDDFKFILNSILNEEVVILINEDDKFVADKRTARIRFTSHFRNDIKNTILIEDDIFAFFKLLSELWNSGLNVKWEKLRLFENTNCLHIPGYQFEKIICWAKDSH